MSGSAVSYRDRIYIIEDIILKLAEYGELNQTALISFCGLNLKKHKAILDEMESNNLITRKERLVGKKSVSVYMVTPEGLSFFNTILAPYEKMFPRRRNQGESTPNSKWVKID